MPGMEPHGQRVPYTDIHFKPLRGSWENLAHPLASNSHLAPKKVMHISNPNPDQDL